MLTDDSNISSSEPTSGRQSGTATPRVPKETSIDDARTLVPSSNGSLNSKVIGPVSRFSKAVKSNIIVDAPEADKAKKEHRERGRVKTDVYRQYILSGGVGAFILLALFTVLGQAVTIGSCKKY
jgi:ATP-binding cassette, subfamily C (CFTR/MRP), member 1